MKRYIYTYEGQKVVIIDKNDAERLGLETIEENNFQVLVSADHCDLLDRENVDYELIYDDCYNGIGYEGDFEIVLEEVTNVENEQGTVIEFVSVDFYEADRAEREDREENA
jgi:hypothetical protein